MKKTGKEMTVKTVAIKKSGRPLLLGEEPGIRIQAFLLAMRCHQYCHNNSVCTRSP